MLKKEYPPTITLRRGLLVIAGIIIFIIALVIIINLDNTAHRNTLLHSKEQFNLATISDTQWFEKVPPKPINSASTSKASIEKLQQGSLPMSPISLTEKKLSFKKNMPSPEAWEAEKQAMQAAISSNVLTPANAGLTISTTSKEGSTNTREFSNKDDPNGQNEKKDFLNEKSLEANDRLQSHLQEPMSPYEIKAGSILPGILVTGLNSDLPGFITGQVRESVYDSTSGKYLLIPQGTKILGRYDAQIVYGQERILVVWNRLIFPNGQSFNLESMPGVDMSGYAGFNDKVNNHYLKIFGSVLLMSVITSGAQLSQPQNDNTNNNNPNVSQTLAASVGSNMALTMEQMTRKNLNIQPTLEIRPGYLFNIMVTKDVVFERPYRGESYEKTDEEE